MLYSAVPLLTQIKLKKRLLIKGKASFMVATISLPWPPSGLFLQEVFRNERTMHDDTLAVKVNDDDIVGRSCTSTFFSVVIRLYW